MKYYGSMCYVLCVLLLLQCLSKLLIVHLFFLVTFPVGVISLFIVYHYFVPADSISFSVAMFNIGILGYFAFYESCPNFVTKLYINILCISIVRLLACSAYVVSYLAFVLLCAHCICSIKSYIDRTLSLKSFMSELHRQHTRNCFS